MYPDIAKVVRVNVTVIYSWQVKSQGMIKLAGDTMAQPVALNSSKYKSCAEFHLKKLH
jgi:hypothetical protein